MYAKIEKSFLLRIKLQIEETGPAIRYLKHSLFELRRLVVDTKRVDEYEFPAVFLLALVLKRIAPPVAQSKAFGSGLHADEGLDLLSDIRDRFGARGPTAIIDLKPTVRRLGVCTEREANGKRSQNDSHSHGHYGAWRCALRTPNAVQWISRAARVEVGFVEDLVIRVDCYGAPANFTACPAAAFRRRQLGEVSLFQGTSRQWALAFPLAES